MDSSLHHTSLSVEAMEGFLKYQQYQMEMMMRGHHPPPMPAHLFLPTPQQLLSAQAAPQLNPAQAPLQPLLPSAHPQLHPAQGPPHLLPPAPPQLQPAPAPPPLQPAPAPPQLPTIPQFQAPAPPPVPARGAPSKSPMAEGIDHIMSTKEALRYLRNPTCYTSQVEDMDRAPAGTLWLFRAPIGKEDVSDWRNVGHQ